MTETAVAASHRCSHFKVKCVETHLANEADSEAKKCDYLANRKPAGLRGMPLLVLL